MSDNSKSSCPFCNELSQAKECVEYYQNKRPDNTKYKFSVALVQEAFLDDYRTGKIAYYGFELNVCPVCGTKIEKENKNGCYI